MPFAVIDLKCCLGLYYTLITIWVCLANTKSYINYNYLIPRKYLYVFSTRIDLDDLTNPAEIKVIFGGPLINQPTSYIFTMIDVICVAPVAPSGYHFYFICSKYFSTFFSLFFSFLMIFFSNFMYVNKENIY